MKNVFTLAGHKFTLKNVQTCYFMSEETTCFSADLHCDGEFLCHCENDGHGGCTFTHPTPGTRDRYYQILEDVGKEVWLTCNDGTIINYDLGTVADEVLCIVEKNKEVAKLQKGALVLEKADGSDYRLYTLKLGATVKIYVDNYPGTLSKKIAECMDDGWTVLNTNIPQKIYDGAEPWRNPALKTSPETCYSGKKEV